MKTIRTMVAAAFLTLAAFTANAGKVMTESIQSKVLSAEVKVNVYVPDGYGKTDVHYPVVYLLHGLSQTYASWADEGHVAMIADELITSGESLPVVIVMPNAGGPDLTNTWNGYFNMPGWNYEDFFFNELIPQIEQKYNAGGSKEQRAVMGLSMGGGATAVYGQRHPDMFSSCYVMSGWLDTGWNQNTPAEKMNKFAYLSREVNGHSALKFIREADNETVAKLKTVKWFIDCGDDDFLIDLSTELHSLMRDKGIRNELRVRNGVHNWEYWRAALRLSLPFASRNFRN